MGEIDMAAYCIFAAAAFDFCDGFAARLLKAYSPIGLQLDSLADVVSFGVAPAAMLHVWLRSIILINAQEADISFICYSVSYIPFIIAIFSALRLAKFNIDTRQTESFLGLPTPANALLIASALAGSSVSPGITSIVGNSVVVIVACIILSALLVSEIPMFSLKFKKQESWNEFFKKYSVQLMFLVLCAIAPFFYGIFSIAIMMLLYITLSVYRWVLRRG